MYVFFSTQEALSTLEDYDKTCVEGALNGVSNVVQQEWGSACPCQVNWQILYTTSSHLLDKAGVADPFYNIITR